MFTIAYANKLMQDAKNDDENSQKDIIALIKEYLLIFLVLLIVDILILVYAYGAVKRCRDAGVIPEWAFWTILVIILSPIISIIIPVLAVLAPFAIITAIGVIIYGNMKCGDNKSFSLSSSNTPSNTLSNTPSNTPLTFAMWKKNKYALNMHNSQKSDDWY